LCHLTRSGRRISYYGTIQNLSDVGVKIIAEGEVPDLERFLKAIDIKNAIIYVSSISKEYSEATGDFDSFYKQVDPGETDSRLDQGIVVLKEILGAIKDMNADIKGMNANISSMSTNISDMNTNLGNKIDDARADIVGEIRELRRDIKEDELVRMKSDIAEIKAKLGL
jgi:acylphosphatase